MIIKELIRYILNIFIIPEKKDILHEIYLDKTEHYKQEIYNFSLDSVFVCLEYEKNLKKLLKSYKFEYNKKLHSDFEIYLKSYMELIVEWIDKKNIIITWVPLHFLNHLKRGYNQTYLLSRWIAKEFFLRFEKLVEKKKHTKQQSKLTRKERLDNLWWVFRIRKEFKDKLDWKTVILIDDVISSWSTSNEIARILKDNWAEKVIGLFLASSN